MSLIALGTIALDNIKTVSGLKKNLLGGSAAHFSMSSSLFTDVHIVSVIGQDFPAKHKKFLEDKGVNLESVIENPGPSFAWTGEYRKGDYNNAITLKTELGVLLDYQPFVSEAQKNISHVFLANFDPQIQMAFLKQMKNPQFVGLDTMNLWIQHQKKTVLKLMKKIHLFVLNDGEACALTGETNLIKAAKKLRRMGPAYVVIKKGEHGVLFYSDDFMFSYSAYPVEKVVDPTGAGDTFAGGLMGYLSKASKVNETTMRKAVIYATTLASFNVEAFGMSKTSGLTMVTVNERRKHYLRFISPK
ncbi:MAG: bifunctional hydroxymethylpyrimidine kinase/phosphomethylpyrimidine kinase [Candidatus Omnitrophica bacterium]|nr:bifunctional hydroxymethylpyrimidine kinase/phosphomethylpyrimidine kinase [Candidatus Omnitrophota bacterium]